MDKPLHSVYIVIFILCLFSVPANAQFNTNVPGACNGNCITPLNGNGTLGQSYNNAACGLNFVQTSNRIGQRFSPAGTGNPSNFNITGIPPCADNPGSMVQAFLWAGTSGNGAAMSVSITNPQGTTQSFPMTVIGSGPDKCWGYSGSYTYRADVTSIVTGNGNYSINGFLVGGTNDVDGATLMIIYRDPQANYRGHIIIHDGTVVVNGGSTTQTVTGINACANSTSAVAFSCVADLQFNGSTITMNGTNATYAFNWWNYTQVNTTVTNGQATSPFFVSSSGDCYNFAVAGLYYQTTSCMTCPDPLTSTLTLNMAQTNATCNNCDGTATVTPSGVSGPYTYSWSPSGGSGSTASNLCAGTYTVTVSANGGCVTNTATVTITNSGSSITVNGTPTNVTCNGSCNGSITASATGGTAPYTYSWSPSGGNNATASGLCPGTYTVVATDNAGCTGSQTFTITQPTAITPTISNITNITCNGLTNGSVTVTPTGGTTPYTYSWSPSGGTGSTATGLGANTYTVTVTDANGCTATSTASVTQPTLVTANITAQTNVSCNGGSNGSLTVTAGGGTAPYTYNWSPSGGSGASATGLSANTYTVTVTDANGCTRTATATITEPVAMTANITATTNVSCYNGTNGSLTVTPGGGSTPYTYSWSPSGGSGATATGLGAGTYTVTITDASGCTRTATGTITQPTQLTSSISAQTNVSCNGGSNGSLTVSTSGGTSPYTYNWSPSGGSGTTASGLAANTYTVISTDNNGCTVSATGTITEPTAVTGAVTAITNVTCNSGNNGSLTVTASGGAGGYTYSWSPSGGNSATASGLSTGTYTCVITDANGCTGTTTGTIGQPNGLTVTVNSITQPSCNNVADGSITITASGGTPGYTYNWSPSGGTGTTASGLAANTYTATVTDNNGCTVTTTATITNPALLTINVTGSGNVTCNGLNDGWATTTSGGGTGALTYSWTPGGGNVASPTNMAPDNYVVTVTDANGCTSSGSVTITEPTALTSNISSSTNVSCYGGSNGSATISGNGGVLPYSYTWSGSGNTNATENNLVAGSYTATVTDANGCTSSSSVTITEPSVFTVSVSTPDNQLCEGESTTVNASANGGVLPAFYGWSGGLPPNASNTVTPASTTTYTVVATDANGCTASNTITINVSPLPVVSFTAPAVCEGNAVTFTSTSTVSAGNIISYTWDYGDFSPVGTGNTTTYQYGGGGTYNVTLSVVTDQGCTGQITQPVDVYYNPVAAFTADVLSGCEPVCVNFSDLSTVGGSAVISTWAWTSGGTAIGTGTNPYYCFNNPGSYDIQLQVFTSDGCQSTLNIPGYISVYANPEAAFFVTPEQIPVSEATVTITDASVNATSWNYSFGDGGTSNMQNPVYTYPDTGTYCIDLVVTTPYGCSDQVTHCVYVYPEFSIFIPNSFTPNDDNINEVFNVVGRGIDGLDMYIYNRWGTVIYHTNKVDMGWNGITDDGVIAKQDVYVYKIYVKDGNSDVHEFVGKINLIR